MHVRRLRAGALALLALLATPSGVRADRVDALAASLVSDPSWRVKVQAAITLARLRAHDRRVMRALLEALRDENEAVRAVAAETLGQLGDASAADPLRTATSDESAGVRAQAKKALAQLEKSLGDGRSGGDSAARWFVSLSEIAAGKADGESARKVHDRALKELGRIAGVTLDPQAAGPTARYWIDGNLTALSAGAPDANGRVHTDCGVRMIVATLPDRSIKMMASLESSVEGSTDPKDLEAARNDCLADAGKQISEKVEAFLESHRQ